MSASIRKLIKDKGLRKDFLAKSLNISSAQLSYAIHGKRRGVAYQDIIKRLRVLISAPSAR